MTKVEKVTQLNVTTPNEVGTMGKVFEAIAGIGVNIRAFCCYAMEDKAYFMLITDSNERVAELMKKMGYEVELLPVITVTVKPEIGTGGRLGKALGDAGVDIDCSYATSPAEGEGVAVFITKNPDKAFEALSKAGL